MRSAAMTAGVTLILIGLAALVIGVLGHLNPFIVNGRSHAAVIFLLSGLALLSSGAALVALVQRGARMLAA